MLLSQLRRVSSRARSFTAVDPDEYKKAVRDRNINASRVITSLLHRSHKSAKGNPIALEKNKGIITMEEKRIRNEDNVRSLELRRMHIDNDADREEWHRRKTMSLLQYGQGITSDQNGTYPWALVSSAPLHESFTLGKVYIQNDNILNAEALYYDRSVKTGCVVEIRSANTKSLRGYGLVDDMSLRKMSSMIKPFLWSYDEVQIDEVFWNSRIRKAMERRTQLLDAKSTNSFRLINGNSDRIPGITVDIINNNGLITTYPIAVTILPSIVSFLVDDLQLDGICVVDGADRSRSEWFYPKELDLSENTKASRGEAIREQFTAKGKKKHQPDFKFRENGITFHQLSSIVRSFPLTGFNFAIHRSSRAFLRSISHGKTVLDLFCGTGGFSAHALAGGAESITAVDKNDALIRVAKQNLKSIAQEGQSWVCVNETIKQNPSNTKQHTTFKHDTYDIVVVDLPTPDTLAQGEDVDRAHLKKDTSLFLQNAVSCVKDNGFILLFSTAKRMSSELMEWLIRAAGRYAGRDIQIVRKLAAAADFPDLLIETSGEPKYFGYLLRISGSDLKYNRSSGGRQHQIQSRETEVEEQPKIENRKRKAPPTTKRSSLMDSSGIDY